MISKADAPIDGVHDQLDQRRAMSETLTKSMTRWLQAETLEYPRKAHRTQKRLAKTNGRTIDGCPSCRAWEDGRLPSAENRAAQQALQELAVASRCVVERKSRGNKRQRHFEKHVLMHAILRLHRHLSHSFGHGLCRIWNRADESRGPMRGQPMDPLLAIGFQWAKVDPRPSLNADDAPCPCETH